MLDVLNNWNPDDTADPHSHRVHQGICRFDATTDYDKALTYRKAEVPFVIRDDPVVLPTVGPAIERISGIGQISWIDGQRAAGRQGQQTGVRVPSGCYGAADVRCHAAAKEPDSEQRRHE